MGEEKKQDKPTEQPAISSWKLNGKFAVTARNQNDKSATYGGVPFQSLTQEEVTKAQAAIGTGMTFALGLWFVPIPVVGSMACNKAETSMVEDILGAVGKEKSEDTVNRLFWFFRKKYFLVNLVTFVPWIGATVQILEVYALGQFVLTCCDENVDIGSDEAMSLAWSEIEPKLWRADDVIAFYETSTGTPFPSAIRGPFVAGVEQVGNLAKEVNKIPGVEKGQEVTSEAIRKGQGMTVAAIKDGFNGLKNFFKVSDDMKQDKPTEQPPASLTKESSVQSQVGTSVLDYGMEKYAATVEMLNKTTMQVTAYSEQKTKEIGGLLTSEMIKEYIGEQAVLSLIKHITSGKASIYDKSIDAIYNSTHIGGGHLHRLFDGSHTVVGMWEKVRDASPDDSFGKEVHEYCVSFCRDLLTPVGLPVMTLSKENYETLSGHVHSTFGIPTSWLNDVMHVDGGELISSVTSTISVALNWSKGDVEKFAGIAADMGIRSIADGNPLLAALTLVVLAKGCFDAKQKNEGYTGLLRGMTKKGIGTGVFVASSAIIGGPAWVGILLGICLRSAVNKKIDTIDGDALSNDLRQYVETSMQVVRAKCYQLQQ